MPLSILPFIFSHTSIGSIDLSSSNDSCHHTIIQPVICPEPSEYCRRGCSILPIATVQYPIWRHTCGREHGYWWSEWSRRIRRRNNPLYIVTCPKIKFLSPYYGICLHQCNYQVSPCRSCIHPSLQSFGDIPWKWFFKLAILKQKNCGVSTNQMYFVLCQTICRFKMADLVSENHGSRQPYGGIACFPPFL